MFFGVKKFFCIIQIRSHSSEWLGGSVTIRRAINILWIFALVAGVVSYLIIEFSAAERDIAGEIVSEGELDVYEFRVGDCIVSLDETPDPDSDGFLVDSGAAVPCSTAHEYEVFSKTTLPQDTPFSGELGNISDEFCESQFQGYLGASYWETTLEITSIFPSEDSHRNGDRQILCLVSEFGDKRVLAGSLRGKGEDYPLVSRSGNPLLLDLVGIPTGTCLNMYDDLYFGLIYESVLCENPHEMEIFFNAPISIEAIEDLELISEERCVEEFGIYLEIPWERSAYTFTYLPPDRESDAADTPLVCFVENEDGSPLLGTARGANR